MSNARPAPGLAGRLTVLVSGMLAGVPQQGGASWAVLQYLLGLRRLGHAVAFVEPFAATALLPDGSTLAGSTNAAYFQQVVAEFGLADSSALLLDGTRETVGAPYAELRRVARRADLLINIAGMLTDEALLADIPVRLYLDLDPAFTQLWQAAGIDMRFGGHTHFATVGLALDQHDYRLPTGGIDWITTVQPIVLEHWPIAEQLTCRALTTVANWRSYGSLEHDGVFYRQKAHSLRRFIDLPRRLPVACALALAIHPDEVADLAALREHGWQLLDPREVAGCPAGYRAFVQGSWAELGIAKAGYVMSRCGWFSDRSICYLASGRPVIAQQTGFDRYLPTGEGLFAFDSYEEVLSAVEVLQHDYPGQRRAARAIAEECFDADKVLTRLLQHVGLAP